MRHSNWLHGILAIILVAFILAPLCLAETVRRDQDFTGKVKFHREVDIKTKRNADAELGLKPNDGYDSTLNWDIEAENADGDLTFNSTQGEVLKITTNGIVTPDALSFIEQTAVGVTNGQAVTLTGGINLLQGTGSPNLNTNTVTVTRPLGGELCYIVNVATASNLVAVASAGAWNSTAVELAAGEAAYALGLSDIDGTGTNAWRGAEF